MSLGSLTFKSVMDTYPFVWNQITYFHVKTSQVMPRFTGAVLTRFAAEL